MSITRLDYINLQLKFDKTMIFNLIFDRNEKLFSNLHIRCNDNIFIKIVQSATVIRSCYYPKSLSDSYAVSMNIIQQ